MENTLVADAIAEAPQFPDKCRVMPGSSVEVTVDIRILKVVSYSIENVPNRAVSSAQDAGQV